jgi:hypothetical protein
MDEIDKTTEHRVRQKAKRNGFRITKSREIGRLIGLRYLSGRNGVRSTINNEELAILCDFVGGWGAKWSRM